MDDTNERIYIATACGENWIELDQSGNIDVYSSNKVSINAKRGINLSSDEDVRITAGKGIHLVAGDTIHAQAANDIHVKTSQNIRLEAGASFYTTATDQLHAKSGSNMNLSSGATMNHAASNDIIQSATTIQQNGPQAEIATEAAAVKAKWTHRVPQHEPYARGMTKDDYSHAPELKYDSPDVNRVERGEQITRGIHWRR
jgi:hypothetical protein